MNCNVLIINLLCAIGIHVEVAGTSVQPEPFILGDPASVQEIDTGCFSAGAPKEGFDRCITGDFFGVYARLAPAGMLTLKLGFVEAEATAPGQRLFQVAANGTPLAVRMDVFAAAGGAFRPYVLRKTYQHEGGSLSRL